MFGEKKPGKMYNLYWYRCLTRLSGSAFSPVLIQCHYTFGKTYLTLKLLVSENATNSGVLMLMCR